MDSKRPAKPLFAAAVLLPVGTALAAALFPAAAGLVERTPWAAAFAGAAAFLLPLPLFFLGFRDLSLTAPAWLRRGVFGLSLPFLALGAGWTVMVLLEYGRGGMRIAAFGLWSLVCAAVPPLFRWAWSAASVPLASPARLTLALGAALMAHAAALGAAAKTGAHAGEVRGRVAQCRAADRAEQERLERDRPRTPDLDAELSACSSLSYRLALADRRRTEEWPVLRPQGWSGTLVGRMRRPGR
ncbi:MAG: hypothetical protein HY928_05860 [Elusimicrobia bacterium]|nr:hypothetical protein [Elusimicrobiota bacterium]